MTCPKCGSENVTFIPREQYMELIVLDWICFDCEREWITVIGEKDMMLEDAT